MKSKISLSLLSLILIASLFLFVPKVEAQTDGVPAPVAESGLFKVLEFLQTNPELGSATNWTFVPYVSHADGLVDDTGKSAEWGGGLAVLYPLNDYVKTGLRMQWFAGNFYMPSANVQLSPTYSLFNTSMRWTPVIYTGIATPIGGSQNNGDLSVLYGAGISLKVPIGDKYEAGIAYGIESWSNSRIVKAEHLALTFGVRF